MKKSVAVVWSVLIQRRAEYDTSAGTCPETARMVETPAKSGPAAMGAPKHRPLPAVLRRLRRWWPVGALLSVILSGVLVGSQDDELIKTLEFLHRALQQLAN